MLLTELKISDVADLLQIQYILTRILLVLRKFKDIPLLELQFRAIGLKNLYELLQLKRSGGKEPIFMIAPIFQTWIMPIFSHT